jgi:excisionase family DNA binding protein
MHKKTRPVFLTPDEGHTVVGKTKISRRSFYNALKRNEIPNIRLGRRILIPRQAFMAWLEQRGAVATGGQAA